MVAYSSRLLCVRGYYYAIGYRHIAIILPQPIESGTKEPDLQYFAIIIPKPRAITMTS